MDRINSIGCYCYHPTDILASMPHMVKKIQVFKVSKQQIKNEFWKKVFNVD